MTINFKERIHGQRWFSDSDYTNFHGLKIFESDRGRIINSAAIRRLQQKTQVFPLERNAAVRSRLTHSMEVQQVGRHISQTIIDKLKKKNCLKEYGLEGLERQFESIVDMSCLMHDIGNPPFGHFGEGVINQWAEKHIPDLIDGHDLQGPKEAQEALKRDLCSFEGNAQGLRIVHSLQTLNLTFTQLSGIIKYTRRGDQEAPDKKDNDYLRKKVGYYLSELSLINTVCEKLKIQEGCRSPFAYVMEAADDISYCIADIEDAVDKRILRHSELSELLNEAFAKLIKSNKFKNVKDYDFNLMEKITTKAEEDYNKHKLIGDYFVALRVGVNGESVKHAASKFVDNIDDIFQGAYNGALIGGGSGCHALLEGFKKVACEKIFSHAEVEGQELQGYKIISGLLDAYNPLLMMKHDSFSDIVSEAGRDYPYENRLYKKLSGKHIEAYKKAIEKESLKKFKINFSGTPLAELSDAAWEFYFRCRLILDYVSGMTDQFALDEYRALNAIE